MFSPFGSPDEDRSTQWHTEPQFRGTYGILSSCLITISLCVWTALHLNIPEYDETKVWPSRTFWRKVGWLTMGLFAPEMVAWTAYEQYKEACSIQALMLNALNQQPSPSWLEKLRGLVFKKSTSSHAAPQNPKDEEVGPDNVEAGAKIFSTSLRHPWTMTHSYYFGMGGYAMDDSDSDQKFMPEDYPRITLLKNDLKTLIVNNICILPDLSESQIKDKSKASGLAKLLVCTQAIWFCAQCIIRLSQNLTICLIELNTFAHALCALLIYLLWWDKPLDVQEPSLLFGEHKDEFIASKLCQPRVVRSRSGNRPDEKKVALILNKSRNELPKGENKPYKASLTFRSSQVVPDCQSPVTSRPLALRKGQSICGWEFTNTLLPAVHFPLDPQEIYGTSLKEVRFESGSKLARQLELCTASALPTPVLQYDYIHSTLPVRTRNWPSADFEQIFELNSEGLRLWVGFSAAGLIYGALHLCAWNAIFPSKAQVILWQLSSITLATSGIMVLSCGRMGEGYDAFERYLERSRGRIRLIILRSSLGVLLFCSVICFCLLYIFARVYLVVACFIDLAHLPVSATKVPVWSQYVPHIV